MIVLIDLHGPRSIIMVTVAILHDDTGPEHGALSTGDGHKDLSRRFRVLGHLPSGDQEGDLRPDPISENARSEGAKATKRISKPKSQPGFLTLQNISL